MLTKDSKRRSDRLEFIVEKGLVLVLDAKQKVDISLWERHEKYLESFLGRDINAGMGERIDEDALRRRIERRLQTFRSDEYRKKLDGCLGVEPSLYE